MLISANNALLSRLIITDKADIATRTKFGRLAFGMEFEKVMEKREWKARAERMLENSGIAQLEDRVLSFLYTHSGAIKLLSLLDDQAMLLQVIYFFGYTTPIAYFETLHPCTLLLPLRTQHVPCCLSW